MCVVKSKYSVCPVRQLLCVACAYVHIPGGPATMHPSVFKGPAIHWHWLGYANPIYCAWFPYLIRRYLYGFVNSAVLPKVVGMVIYYLLVPYRYSII